MKRLLILFVAILIFSTVVSAALTLQDEVLLGNKDQRRSNPEADDKDDEVEYTETIFTLASTIKTNVSVTLSEEITDTNRYNASLSTNEVSYVKIAGGIKFNINPGQPIDIMIRAKVPSDLDAVDANLELLQNRIGTITANDGTNTDSAPLRMQAENMLLLENVRVCVNTKCENMDDGDDFKDIKPEDTVTVEVEAKNDFDDKENIDIQNVNVFVRSVDGNLDDFDEDDDMGDLTTEDTDTVLFEFEVADDQDRDDYDVEVIVEGEDENGAKHGERWIFTLQIDREKNDIVVQDMVLEPLQAECGEQAVLTVDVKNRGRNDVDDVTVSIRSLALGNLFQKSTDYVNVDQDDDTSFVFYIDVPEDVEAGPYRIDAQTFYDKTKRSDKSKEASQSVVLTVVCGEGKPVVPPEGSNAGEYVQTAKVAKATLAVPITFLQDGEQHTISAVSFDTQTESATVVLGPVVETLSLSKGAPQRVDLDLDGKDDLIVALWGVSQDGVLEMQLQEITYGSETPSLITTGSYTPTTPTGAVITEPESMFDSLFKGSGYMVTLAIIDLVIIIVAVLLIARAVRKK